MKKRILSLLLLAAMAASLLTLPAMAAPAAVRFSDIHDNAVAKSVESLRLMGVMDGYSDGSFRPNGQLTRAQFCKMVVCAMNAEDELGLYRTVTVYPDVKPSHWAAAYINMASKGKKVISGFSDGKFYPDRTVTLGQAATILLRVLGYKDENIGGVWPDSYLSFAASINLTDGISSKRGSDPLTRSDAAILFSNLLQADYGAGADGKGGSFLASTGLTTKEDMVLVSSTAKGPDGRETAMLFSNGEVYQMAGDKASNGSLNGSKGTLVLDGQKVRTFLPESMGSSRNIVAATVDATQITDLSGVKYSVNGTTSVYYKGKEQSWSSVYTWLNHGTSMTLYLSSADQVEYIFVGGSGSAVSEAVVVYQRGSVNGFSELAGGSGGYSIYKNGTPARAADMRPYDVATYSSATNTIQVCDTRLTGYYEECSPNPTAPTSVKLMGHEFPVLTTAQASLSAFKPGDNITLLLTEDNQVDGAVRAGTSGASGNALGIVKSASSGGASVDLLCGITVSGSVSLGSTEAELMQGQLVRVTSPGEKGAIGLARLSGGASGTLDLERRRLGSTSLADNVAVFEYKEGKLQSVSLSDLGGGSLPASRVTYARLNWAEKVDLIILDGVGFGTVFYGRATVTRETNADNKQTLEYILVQNGRDNIGPFPLGQDIRNGDYVAITRNGSNTGYGSLKKLELLQDVPNTAWSGQSAVTVNGRTYTIPSTVACYNRDTGAWVSLSEAHAYAIRSNLYASSDGIIRAIEVGSRYN